MIVAKFFDNGKPTTLTQDIQKEKKHRVKIITQRFGNGKEDYDIAVLILINLTYVQNRK